MARPDLPGNGVFFSESPDARLDKLRKHANAAKASNRVINALSTESPTTTKPTATNQVTGTLVRTNVIGDNQDKYHLCGGQVKNTESSNYGLVAVTRTTGANIGGFDQSVAPAVEFYTDCDDWCIRVVNQGETKFRVAVDDRYLTSGADTYGDGGSSGFIRYVFSTAVPRKVRFESQYGIKFGSHYLKREYSVWKGDLAQKPKACFVTDSYGDNTNPGFTQLNFPQLVGALLGWDVTTCSLGGTGYATDEPANGVKGPEHMQDVARQNFDVIAFFLGTNDNLGGSHDAVQANALSCFRQARALNKTALIIAGGIWPRATGPSQTLIDREGYVQAALTQANDPFAWFLPITTDPEGPWFVGVGDVTSAATDGNNDRFLLSDKTHINAAGQLYVARRMAHSLRRMLGV